MNDEHPKQIVARYGVTPKKSLGQNFLFDPAVLDQIASAAWIDPSDDVLEIGPGLGHLTRVLALRAQHVTAVELDQRFLPVLTDRLAEFQNVTIVHGDILSFDTGACFPNTPFKVIANVPFYITGAILRHLFDAAHKPVTTVLTVQREVADRLIAEAGDLTLLGVSAQFYAVVERVQMIKAGAFWPRPAVDAAVVRLATRSDRVVPPAGEALFFQLVKCGFSQKRKQLHKNLRQLNYSRAQIRAALEHAHIDGTRRAQTLSINEWGELHDAFAKLPQTDTQNVTPGEAR